MEAVIMEPVFPWTLGCYIQCVGLLPCKGSRKGIKGAKLYLPKIAMLKSLPQYLGYKYVRNCQKVHGKCTL